MDVYTWLEQVTMSGFGPAKENCQQAQGDLLAQPQEPSHSFSPHMEVPSLLAKRKHDFETTTGVSDNADSEGGAPQCQRQQQAGLDRYLVAELRASTQDRAQPVFEASARAYASPLFNTYKQLHSRCTNRVYAAQKCASGFVADDILLSRVKYSEGEAKQQAAISVIKFDRMGVLFAVGGVNGVVRVFDFDECLLGMSAVGSKECIKPVVSVDTRRIVSDLAWSLTNDDEISVCFSSRSDIFVYDLLDLTEPVQTLQVGKNVPGGHTIIMYIKSHCNGAGNEQHIIAGGKSGHIRKWSVTSSPSRVKWEVCAAPSNAIHEQASPVVGLAQIDGRRLISINQCGVIAVWDLVNMTVPAFGMANLPTLLAKASLTGGDVSVSGMSFTPTYVCQVHNPAGSADGDICGESNILVQGQLLVTMVTGDIRLIDLHDNARTLLAKLTLSSGMHRLGPTIYLQDDVSRSLQAATRYKDACTFAPACAAISPPIFNNGQICCTSCGPNLRFFQLGKIRASGSQAAVASLFKRGPSIPASFYPQQQQPLKKAYSFVNFVQSFKPCFTLPGHILSVEHGSKVVIVTKNVTFYLCAAEQSASYPSRSHKVYLDWSRSHEGAQPSGAVFSVADLQPYVIDLTRPYTGPTVTNGLPRVHLRTNLSLSVDEDEDSRSSRPNQCEHVEKRDCFIYQTDQPPRPARQPSDQPATETSTTRVAAANITAIACHARLPHILVGRADDSVVITSGGGGFTL